MQHFLLALAMLLLIGIAAKERTAVREPGGKRLLQQDYETGIKIYPSLKTPFCFPAMPSYPCRFQ